MNTKDRLVNYFRAAFPGIAIQTTEEIRAMGDVYSAAKEVGRAITVWSCTEGVQEVFPNAKEISDTEDLLSAMKQRPSETVMVFRDIHTWPFDRDPMLARGLRDLLTWAPNEGSCVVILAPEYRPHPTCEKMITVLEYALPSKDDLQRITDGIADSAKPKKIKSGEEIIRALGGLSTTEAENALALSLVENGKFDPEVIYREKVLAVKRSGLLEVVEADPRGLSGIGGLEELKAWIAKRKRAYSPEAVKFGLPSPKGVLLVGVPGTGKSLSAKAFGTALGVPTIKLDIGALFNSLVGESEARTRDALKLAEAMSPCVLWVDEIDKGLSGSSGASGDSGVTRRVFGTIISWMQERRRPVFLVATANQVEGLPPELLRKGRFDEIFAVDLPNENERAAIFGLHLERRGRKELAEKFGKEVILSTNGFTGSEIENVIEEAMFNAFDLDRDITEQDLVTAARATTPLSVTAKEQIERIREWAKTRARFASKPLEIAVSTGRRKLAQAE